MMTIVATRKSALCAEAFARAMVDKSLSHQQINQIKTLMLNQFRGHINQLTGMVTKSAKRYWLFNGGLGGVWRFDFVIYPVQQLIIISSLYAVSEKQLPFYMQRRQAQQIRTNEGKSIVKLNEADLRYVISEVSKRILQKTITENYKSIGGGYEFGNGGGKQKSVVTLENEAGQRFHIGIDDGCYVLYAERDTPLECAPVTHIFPEAAWALSNSLSQ